MKRMKKLASLVLATIMVLAMAIPTAAANGSTDTKGSITIKNTVKDESYSIYRIFDLESFNTDPAPDGAYSYKVNSDWRAFIDQTKDGENVIKGVYVNEDDNGYVTWVEDAAEKEFAELALAYATAEGAGINPVETKKSTADGSNVEFTNLKLGYYLVKSSVGALCSLDTTNPDATVTEKNSNPTLVKEVKEGEKWGEKNDANIGDTVEFKATITVQGTVIEYVMHDKMSEGLTFGNVTSVTKGGVDVAVTDYDVVSTGLTDNCDFEVKFKKEFCDSLKSGDKIIVYYNATLNGNAVIADEGNPNEAYLAYKDNNNVDQTTTTDKTTTYTWKVPVLKYANGDPTKVLEGAKFSLYTDEATTTEVKFTDVKKEGETTVYRVDKAGTVSEITTDATGTFRFEGLDSGTYYLKETEAPAGYNKLNTVVTVIINSDGKINVTEEEKNGVEQIGVNNNSGSLLPTTGGIGTTIFYVVGGILVVAAAVLLVTRKRMSTEK